MRRATLGDDLIGKITKLFDLMRNFLCDADSLRSKQIINPDRFSNVCRGLLFDKLEFVSIYYHKLISLFQYISLRTRSLRLYKHLDYARILSITRALIFHILLQYRETR